MGAGRRLYTVCSDQPMPGRAPYAIVRCPAGVVKDQPYTGHQISPLFLQRKFVKIRKPKADPDSDGVENHTCSRLQKISIALVRCMLFILSCSAETYIFWFLEVKYLCRCDIQTSYDARPGTIRCPDGLR